MRKHTCGIAEPAGGDGAKRLSPLFVEQAEQAELQTEIAEREAEGFRVVVVNAGEIVEGNR